MDITQKKQKRFYGIECVNCGKRVSMSQEEVEIVLRFSQVTFSLITDRELMNMLSNNCNCCKNPRWLFRE